MNDVTVRVAAAASLLWLGMVLAISFLEAPLKFRAPGVDLRTGLAIGRLVFRAVNVTEVGWAVVIVLALIVHSPPSVAGTVAAILVVAVLAVQLGVVRPRLNRRSDQVLAGADVPRSSSHHVYIALEIVKVIGLTVLAAAALSG
jgi:hypothetical protein